MNITEKNLILKKAVKCYINAGWTSDACRIFELLNEKKQAAIYYEKLGQWKKAAECYLLINSLNRAAECFIECKMYKEAADCYINLGRNLLAAWLIADKLSWIGKARYIISNIQTTSKIDRVSIEIISARCDIKENNKKMAERRIKIAIYDLYDMPVSVLKDNIFQWIFRITEILKRPDLIKLNDSLQKLWIKR